MRAVGCTSCSNPCHAFFVLFRGGGAANRAACRAFSNPVVSPDWLKIGTVFEEGSEGLMASEEGSGTGSAGELMDLMRQLLRLREGACVAFEDRKDLASIESWSVGLKRGFSGRRPRWWWWWWW